MTYYYMVCWQYCSVLENISSYLGHCAILKDNIQYKQYLCLTNIYTYKLFCVYNTNIN